MNPSDKVIVPFEQKQVVVRNVSSNAALGAAVGMIAGVGLTLANPAAFPLAGVIGIAGGIGFIIALAVFFINSGLVQHVQTKQALARVTDLHRKELISRNEYDHMKQDLLAHYTQPNKDALSKAITAGKFSAAGTAWLGVMMIALSSPALLSGLIGSGIGAFCLLIGSTIYRLAIEEYLYGPEEERKAIATAERPSLDEGERVPLFENPG